MYELVGIAVAVLTVYLVATHEYQNRKRFIREDRQREGKCEKCGYDLRGSRHAMICPECGTEFEIRAKMPSVTHPLREPQGRKNSA